MTAKPLSCYLGLHGWEYTEFVVVGIDGLQKRKCRWCGRKEGRAISKNTVTGWYA
jgi:hypothetical protein